MQSKSLNTDYNSQPSYQDWSTKNLGSSDTNYVSDDTIELDEGYGDSYDNSSPEVDSYSQQEAAQPALDSRTVRINIYDLINFAKQQGASDEMIAKIKGLLGDVNRAAAYSPKERESLLHEIMDQVCNLQGEVVSDAAKASSGEVEGTDAAGAPERKQELQAKLDQLKQQVANDPSIDNYIEKNQWNEQIDKAQASLDLGNLDDAEVAIMDIEQGLKTIQADKQANDLERLKGLQSSLNDLQSQVDAVDPSSVEDDDERKQLSDQKTQLNQEIQQTLADLLSGALSLDDAEKKVKDLTAKCTDLSLGVSIANID